VGRSLIGTMGGPLHSHPDVLQMRLPVGQGGPRKSSSRFSILGGPFIGMMKGPPHLHPDMSQMRLPDGQGGPR